MSTITYLGEDRSIPVTETGMTILDISIANRIPHLRECGGNGRCTTCRVRIHDGIENVLPRTQLEAWVADTRLWDRFTRLACQTRVNGDVTIERLIRRCEEVSRVQLEEAAVAPPEERTLAVLFGVGGDQPQQSCLAAIRAGLESSPGWMR